MPRFAFVHSVWICSLLGLLLPSLALGLNKPYQPTDTPTVSRRMKIILPKDLGNSAGDFMQLHEKTNRIFTLSNGSLMVFDALSLEVLDEIKVPPLAMFLTINEKGNYLAFMESSKISYVRFDGNNFGVLKTIKGRDLDTTFTYDVSLTSGIFRGNDLEMKTPYERVWYDVEAQKIKSRVKDNVYTSVMSSAVSGNTMFSIVIPENKYALRIWAMGQPEKIVSLPPGIYSKVLVFGDELLLFTTRSLYWYNWKKEKYIAKIIPSEFSNFKTSKNIDSLLQASAQNPLYKSTRDDVKCPIFDLPKGDAYIYDAVLNEDGSVMWLATSSGVYEWKKNNATLDKVFPGLMTSLEYLASQKTICGLQLYPRQSIVAFSAESKEFLGERKLQASPIYFSTMSQNGRYMFTNSKTKGVIWDMQSYTKLMQVQDVSENDSSYVSKCVFLNDTLLYVGGNDIKGGMNIGLFNLKTRQYIKTIRRNSPAILFGVKPHGEIYLTDMYNLKIISLDGTVDELYQGLFSEKMNGEGIAFSKDYIVVSNIKDVKTRVIERKSRKVVTEVNYTVETVFSNDGKKLLLLGEKDKSVEVQGSKPYVYKIRGVQILDCEKGTTQDIMETPTVQSLRWDKDDSKIFIWYFEHGYGEGFKDGKRFVYKAFDVQSGKELFAKILPGIEYGGNLFCSENGKYFVLGDMMSRFGKVYDKEGNEVLDLIENNISMYRCYLDETNDRAIFISNGPMMDVVDLKKRVYVGSITNADGDDFFIMNHQGHYFGAKDFVKNIRFKHKNETFSFEQFDVYLNKPHEVLKSFGSKDTLLISSYAKAYQKRIQLMGNPKMTELDFSALPTLQVSAIQKTSKEGEYLVQVQLHAKKGSLRTFEVLNNGVPIFRQEWKVEDNKREWQESIKIKAVNGLNQLEFKGTDENGLVSPALMRYVRNGKEKSGKLYLLVMASEKFKDSNYDLAYAVKDAGDVASLLALSSSFEEVKVKKMFNQSFASDSIGQIKQFLAEVTQEDVVMFFFAGHGYLGMDLGYYFPTWYTNFDDPSSHAVAYAELENILKEVKALKKVMFIDACFSGEVDEDELPDEPGMSAPEKKEGRTGGVKTGKIALSSAMEITKSLFADVRKSGGATVISSAGGLEAALEGEKWNNGLFTHCLLKGLQEKKADLNKDGRVMLSELQRYVAETVFELSEGKQLPSSRVENSMMDFEIWRY